MHPLPEINYCKYAGASTGALSNEVLWWHCRNQYSPRQSNVSAFEQNHLLYFHHDG